MLIKNLFAALVSGIEVNIEIKLKSEDKEQYKIENHDIEKDHEVHDAKPWIYKEDRWIYEDDSLTPDDRKKLQRSAHHVRKIKDRGDALLRHVTRR